METGRSLTDLAGNEPGQHPPSLIVPGRAPAIEFALQGDARDGTGAVIDAEVSSVPGRNSGSVLSKGRPQELTYYVVGIWSIFRDKTTEKDNKLSLLELVTGRFRTLLPRKRSLFFLSLDGLAGWPKDSKLCSMCAAPRVHESQNLTKSLLNSLLAGKMPRESGSLETASTTIKSQGPRDLAHFITHCPVSPRNSRLWPWKDTGENSPLAGFGWKSVPFSDREMASVLPPSEISGDSRLQCRS